MLYLPKKFVIKIVEGVICYWLFVIGDLCLELKEEKIVHCALF